jgi:hypothetical protein
MSRIAALCRILAPTSVSAVSYYFSAVETG